MNKAPFESAYLLVSGNEAPEIMWALKGRPCEYQHQELPNYEAGLASAALADFVRGAENKSTFREDLGKASYILHSVAALGGYDVALFEIYENGSSEVWAVFVVETNPENI